MSDSADYAPDDRPLRRGWTTGACATAAAKAALAALRTGRFEDPVTITLPGGQTPAFVLAHEAMGEGYAEAGIIKDAGDDPDVTHGALIITRVARGVLGSGVTFHAGDGVGTVTKPGLPIHRASRRSKIGRAAGRERVENVGGGVTVKKKREGW